MVCNTNSAIAHKKKLISSIFPEKIEFDGKKCRTTRINDVLRYILQIDKELGENKKGQISKNMILSRVVEPRGVKSNYFGADLELLK
jgi:site-specific DNA recombinase